MAKPRILEFDAAEFDRLLERAKQTEEDLASREARAVDAWFEEETGEVCIRLSRGSRLCVPHDLIEGLQDAVPEDLNQIVLFPEGTALRWPTLDVDLSVPGLAMEVFGSRTWMRELASRAGKSTSEAKRAAARLNGRKGGRPRKRSTPI